jgi:hypothetical protein
VIGVADQVPDLLAGGIAGRRHRSPLDVGCRLDHLDDLCHHLSRGRSGRLDPEDPVETDGGIVQAPAQ